MPDPEWCIGHSTPSMEWTGYKMDQMQATELEPRYYRTTSETATPSYTTMSDLIRIFF